MKKYLYLLALLVLNASMFSQIRFSGGEATWDLKWNGYNLNSRSTDSLRFVYNQTSKLGSLYLYTHKNETPTITRILAIANNVTGPGTYSIATANVNETGTTCSMQNSDNGFISISQMDIDSKFIEGTFELNTTCYDDVNNKDYAANVTNGKFKMGKYWLFTILDGNSNMMKNKKISVSKVSGNNPLNNEKVGDYITNDSSRISIGESKLKKTDKVIFEIAVDTIRTTKPNHQGVDGIKYIVRLDNMDIGEQGYVNFKNPNELNKNDTVKMLHTTLLYNLVVSVEWNAKPEYLNTVASWFKKGSSYIYNVTNGQCMLHKIEIYDNSVNSNDADMIIKTSNMDWPCANPSGIDFAQETNINYPRIAWSGDNINGGFLETAKPTWMSYDPVDNFRTIMHEFGHYGFGFRDEYCDQHKNTLTKTINFGFMDNQRPNNADAAFNDEYSSEMSDPGRIALDAIYSSTSQKVNNGRDCWTFFKNKYEREYGQAPDKIFCLIRTPQSQIRTTGLTYVPGPEESDWDISRLFEFNIIDAGNTSIGDFNLTIPPENEPGWVPSTLRVNLLKQTEILIEGAAHIDRQGIISGYDRKAIILGASIHDTVLYEYNLLRQVHFRTEHKNVSGKIDINVLSQANKDEFPNILVNNSNTSQSSVDSNFSYINSWAYNSSAELELKHYTEANYLVNPYLTISKYGNTLKTIDLNYNSSENVWKAVIKDTINPRGYNFLNFYYKPDSTFFSGQYASISKFWQNIYTKDGSASILFDTLTKGIETVAFFSTQFTPLTKGLQSFSKNASDIYSLAVYPNLVAFDGASSNYLTIQYISQYVQRDEEKSLKMFKFNEVARSWELVGGTIDTVNKYVNAKISSPGVYSLFTTVQGATSVIDGLNEGLNLQIIPNPVNNFFELSNIFPIGQNVELKIYNQYGEMVVESEYVASNPITRISTADLAVGVYFCTISSGQVSRTGKFVIIR